MSDSSSSNRLVRELGLFGAVMMGLGSIVGTGVFVSLGVAAGVTGPAVIIAVAIGAGVATCNGLSSAQLAANHAVSGGTYEYGYKYLTPRLGFTAGWMFLIAKSMSAATAALGFAGYLLGAFGIEAKGLLVPVALGAVLGLTGVVLSGMRRSNAANITIVSITLSALLFFVVAGSPTALSNGTANFAGFFEAPDGSGGLSALLYASALMFVAYTGYGRIATLGEEVKQPRTTIPRAIILTLVVTMTLYIAVAAVAVGSVGPGALSSAAGQDAAPLVVAARSFGVPGASQILSFGAVTAMLGVLLNLILGLSRVLLAMGRRGDVPTLFGQVNAAGTTPVPSVLAVGLGIAGLTLIGDVKTTWSFSAFTVLVYYALTNLSALYIPRENQLYPRWIAATGLLACGGLAFFVTPWIWLTGLGLIAAGIVWQGIARWQRDGATGS
jgi:APA family basic amino acid/polyamine antiporter